VQRVTAQQSDPVLGGKRKLRQREPVWVYGTSGGKNWSRAATRQDVLTAKRALKEPVPGSVPNVAIPWGDLYRSGYHTGITHLHHFYTMRNLVVFGRLWDRTFAYEGALGDALRFWLLSYNASHATIMTRVVAKAGQDDLVVTSGQPGVLYVSGLPVEKNLFSGLRRKMKTIADAFAITHGLKGKVQVVQASSADLDLPTSSIDYVFTDPPFGGNIPYAEVNFINEAWLGHYTDRKGEAIVSPAQGKCLADYQQLLAASLGEARRVLKDEGQATLVFHSATAGVWNALQSAYSEAGFSVKHAGILDKTQGSFKQVTTSGAVKGDPVLLLEKAGPAPRNEALDVWTIADQLLQISTSASDPKEQTPERLYSRLIAYYLTRNQIVPLDADAFYRWHKEQRRKEAPQYARHAGT
jgi:predicted RNA methylase